MYLRPKQNVYVNLTKYITISFQAPEPARPVQVPPQAVSAPPVIAPQGQSSTLQRPDAPDADTSLSDTSLIGPMPLPPDAPSMMETDQTPGTLPPAETLLQTSGTQSTPQAGDNVVASEQGSQGTTGGISVMLEETRFVLFSGGESPTASFPQQTVSSDEEDSEEEEEDLRRLAFLDPRVRAPAYRRHLRTMSAMNALQRRRHFAAPGVSYRRRTRASDVSNLCKIYV